MNLLPNATCSFICPTNTYVNSTAFICAACNTACLICWGPYDSECSRCGNSTDVFNQTVIYYLIYGKSKCSADCIAGQFKDPNIPNYCQICNSACLTCVNTSNTCTSCRSGNYLDNLTCTAICSKGKYATLNLTCLSCITGCETCTAANLNSCQSCTSGFYLVFGTTSCSTSCPSNQYATTNNTCQLCKYFIHNGNCVQSCPSGFVGVIDTISTCAPCTTNCSR
jgi:proprotein convertase subtilisin/kexin type 5